MYPMYTIRISCQVYMKIERKNQAVEDIMNRLQLTLGYYIIVFCRLSYIELQSKLTLMDILNVFFVDRGVKVITL